MFSNALNFLDTILSSKCKMYPPLIKNVEDGNLFWGYGLDLMLTMVFSSVTLTSLLQYLRWMELLVILKYLRISFEKHWVS